MRVLDVTSPTTVTLAVLFMLALLPATFGVPGYIGPVAVMTMGYALFQAANNTVVMTGIRPGERGVISGLLNLSRNLGLVTGAAALGEVFAVGGMPITFAVAGGLIVAALGIATKVAPSVAELKPDATLANHIREQPVSR